MLYKNITRYQHVERLGKVEVKGLLDGTVYVQEKLDGANMTVAYVNDEIVLCSRNRFVGTLGDCQKGGTFLNARDYVRDHGGYHKLFKLHPDWVLRGEWVDCKHHIKDYDCKNSFIVFDVQVPKETKVDEEYSYKYLTPEEYQIVLLQFGIPYVPTIVALTNPTPELLATYAPGASGFGAKNREGVVVKRPGFVNTWGHTVWAKLIAKDFIANKQEQSKNPSAKQPHHLERKFAEDCVDKDFILKTLYKLRDEVGEEFGVKYMAELMGRVWYDVFNERLWGFQKKAKRIDGGRPFDFLVAQKLVSGQVKEVALGYFNGMEV